MENTITKKKRQIKVPHTMTILFVVLIIASIATYVAPTGTYDRVTNESGVTVVDPNSYHEVERTPTSLKDFMLSIPVGLVNNASVFGMVLFSLAGIQVLNESKAIDAGILTFVSKRKNAALPAIIAMSILYGVIGVTASWSIGFTPFVPITIAVVRALGYDDLLGAAVVILPGACGWTSGVINVYSTAIAQGYAGLPIFSGMWMRILSFVVFMAVALTFIISYALRYQKNRTPEEVEAAKHALENHEEFTIRRKIALAFNVLGLCFLAYGTTAWGWMMNEISGYWIIVGIITGFIMGWHPTQICQSFTRGLQGIIGAAIIIGLAAAIIVVLQDGGLMDSVVHGLSVLLAQVPTPLVGVGIFVVTVIMNFFISGVNGKVVSMMPLLSPLGQVLGVNQQVIVLAFIFGDGFTNWFWPTASVCVAALGAGNLDYARWAKFIWKPMLALNIAAGILVFVAQLIGYGPF